MHFFMYTTVFFKQMTTCIQQECIKLIKRDSKDMHNISKVNKFCSFELCILERKHEAADFNIDNNKKKFLEQQISILE